jgi:hypothetical protein
VNLRYSDGSSQQLVRSVFCRLPAGISVCHRLQPVVDGHSTVFLQPDFSRLLFGEGSRLEARLKEESAFIALQTTG